MSRRKTSEEKAMRDFMYIVSKMEQCEKLSKLMSRYNAGETYLDYELLSQINHLKDTYNMTDLQIDKILEEAE